MNTIQYTSETTAVEFEQRWFLMSQRGSRVTVVLLGSDLPVAQSVTMEASGDPEQDLRIASVELRSLQVTHV